MQENKTHVKLTRLLLKNNSCEPKINDTILIVGNNNNCQTHICSTKRYFVGHKWGQNFKWDPFDNQPCLLKQHLLLRVNKGGKESHSRQLLRGTPTLEIDPYYTEVEIAVIIFCVGVQTIINVFLQVCGQPLEIVMNSHLLWPFIIHVILLHLFQGNCFFLKIVYKTTTKSVT